jgi:hypothetical protein
MRQISLLILLFCCVPFWSKAQSTQDISEGYYYTIDFVFTGKVKGQTDSVFALQYTFPIQGYKKIKKILFVDSKRQWAVNADISALNDSLEVVRNKNEVKFIIRKYDKYDFPVLMRAEDHGGKGHDLHMRKKSGAFQSGPQLNDELRRSRNMINRSN